MAQACHACQEIGKIYSEQRDTPDTIIVLQVSNKEELLNACNNLELVGIKTNLFFEPDWDYGYTSFATQPVKDSQRIHMKGYKLWK